MRERRRAGDEEDVGRALEEPSQGDLHRSRLQGRGDLIELGRLQGRESSQGEERNVGDALPGEGVEEGVNFSIGHVVEILDANDVGDFLRLLKLLWSDVAKTEVANQSLAL